MKKLILIIFIAFAYNVSFSQMDTTAIFHKVDSLINVGDNLENEGKYNEALEIYNQAFEMTKDINGGDNTDLNYTLVQHVPEKI